MLVAFAPRGCSSTGRTSRGSSAIGGFCLGGTITTAGEPVNGAWIRKREATGMLMSWFTAKMTSTVLSGRSCTDSTAPASTPLK
jgi:hypothetical protein